MSLWDDDRVNRYLRLYNDPREKTGSQSRLCKDIAGLIKGITIADFGCGLGHLIPYLDPRLSYMGIDSSESMIAKAQELFPEKDFLVADVRKEKALSSLYSMGYTATVAVSLFIHLSREDMLQVLGNMWLYTKPGGILVFSMETNGNLEEKRPDGLLIRNQSVESVLTDILSVTKQNGAEIPQKVTTATISEFYTTDGKVKITGLNQISRTSIFWVIKPETSA